MANKHEVNYCPSLAPAGCLSWIIAPGVCQATPGLLSWKEYLVRRCDNNGSNCPLRMAPNNTDINTTSLIQA